MVQVFNDKYEDKYVRATYVYAKDNSGTLEAYADAAKTVAIKSADLYEIGKKGAIVVTADGEFFPVAVTAAGVSTPASLTIINEVSNALVFVEVVAVDD